MIDFLKDVWRFIRKRDSESACMLCIGLTNELDNKHVKDLADYFQSVLESRTMRLKSPCVFQAHLESERDP